MGRKSKNKGKRGEREAAGEVSRLFRVQARRGVQYQGGPESPDVNGLPGVHIEVKRCESLSIYTAMAQARRDAGEEDIPIVLHRRNGKQWLCVVDLEDLPALVSRLFLILAEQ